MTIRAYERLLVILDYDGTITLDDCNEVVLQAAVGDAWRRSEEAMLRGEISPDEAFRTQIGLLRVPRDELLTMSVAAARLRPGFGRFLRELVEGGARVAVVSAGFRAAISAVWRREGLPPVELYASELTGDHLAGYGVAFDPLARPCERCSHCKGHILRHIRGDARRVVVFGDGEADLCLAREADAVFARRRLAELCERHAIEHTRFEDYSAVLDAATSGVVGVAHARGR